MSKKRFLKLLMVSAALITTAIVLSSGASALVSSDLRDSLPTATRNASLPTHNHATAVAGRNESQENIEVEVVMARANGFEPAVITRPQGPFVLGIHNQSGAGELVLLLERAQGGQVQELRLRTGRRRQHQLLDLPIGEYVLSEATHSRWRCQIIITR